MALNDSPIVATVNKLAVGLMHVPLVGGLVRGRMIEIRYVGRKSGRTFQIPVGYRRSGDRVVVGVNMPDRKGWWRNFLGEGAPITLVGLDGRDRSGHAVATRDQRGGVSVAIDLD